MSLEREEAGLDALRLPEDVAQRLLARAGELDAHGAGISVAQLRQAATEAGISASAFEVALRELWRDVADVTISHAPGRPRSRGRSMRLGSAPPRRKAWARALAAVTIFDAGAASAVVATMTRDVPRAERVRLAPTPAPSGGTARTYFEFQVEKPVVQSNQVAPAYPSLLQSQGVSGQVIAQYVVDESGRVDLDTFKVIE